VCALAGPLASGKFAVSGVAVRATRAVREGDYPIAVALLDGDNATAGSTQFTVRVRRGVTDALFVHSGGQQLSALGAMQDRRINIFNLGGSGNRGAIQLQLGNVLPARIATEVSARGARWNCPSGSGAPRCTFRAGAFAPGEAAPELQLSYRIPPTATTDLKQIDGGHRFRWQMTVSGAPRVEPTIHVETEHLLPKPTPTPNRPARVVTSPGNMIVKVNQLGRSRLGGIGGYRITVNNGGRRPVVGAELRIRPPAHASILRFGSAVGWRCSTVGVCTRTDLIASHRAAPPLEVVLTSKATSNAQATQTLAVEASWQGVKGTRSTHRATATDTWDPLLAVSTAGSSVRIHDRAAAGSKGMLTSSVTGLAKQKYSYRWRQICPPQACPRVSWDQTPHGNTPHVGNSVAFTPPIVRRPTELRFLLIVRAAGAEVRKQVSVMVLPFSPKVDARLGTTKWRAPKFPSRVDRAANQGTVVKPGASLVINATGPTSVGPGERVTLRAALPSPAGAGRDLRIAWRGHGEAQALVASAKATDRGRQLTFIIPRGFSRPAVISAIAKSGNRIIAGGSELIVPRLPRPKPETLVATATAPTTAPTAAPSTRAGRQAVADATSPAASAFCTMYSSAATGSLPTLQFASANLTLGSVSVSGANCSTPGAAITFSGGQTEVGGTGLSQLAGSITANGLSLNSGVLQLPQDPSVPPELTTIPFTGGSAGLTAFVIPFAGSTLGSLTGTINLSTLPYLKLPKGWSLTNQAPQLSQLIVIPAPGGSGYAAQLTAYATGPDQGSASVTGQVNTDGSFSLYVSGANLWPLTGSDGSTAVFSGAGTVSRAVGQGIAYDVSMEMVTKNAAFPLYGGFSLQNASLSWTNSGLAANATGIAVIGGQNHTFSVTGTLTDFHNWSLTVQSSESIAMTYLDLNNLGGSISMTKVGRNPSVLAIDVFGQAVIGPATLTKLGLTVNTATGHVGIYCNNIAQLPQNARDACQNKTLQLQLDLTGSATLFGKALPIDATANANITDGSFNLQAAIQNTAFGPATLNLSDITFFATDNAQNAPELVGNPCMSDPSLANRNNIFGFTATYDAGNGFTGTATGVYNTSFPDAADNTGYCLSAAVAQGQANTAIPGSMGSFSNDTTFIYSSYPTTVTINNTQTIVNPQQATVLGNFTLPSAVQDFLNTPQLDNVLAELTLGGATSSASLTASLPETSYIIGDANSSTSLQLQSAGVVVGKVNGAWSFGVNLAAQLKTPGSPGTDPTTTTATVQNAVAAGTVPVSGSLMYAPDSGAITMSAEIGNGTVIDDAFGFDGFDLEAFKVMASVGGEPKDDFVGVSANVLTPSTNSSTFGKITEDIGLQPNTDISFAFQLSETSPCYAIQIGNPNPAQQTLAISWFDVIEANFVQMYFAPNGCAVETTALPSSGYAFDFDGAILGTPTKINGQFSTGPGALFSGSLTINVGSFSLSGIDVQNTVIDLTFADYPTQQFDLQFSGGINIWGAIQIQASGDIDVQAGTGVGNSHAKVKLNATQNEDLFGLFTDNISFGFDCDWEMPDNAAPHFSSLDMSLTSSVKVLVFTGSASAWFDYGPMMVNGVSQNIVTSMGASFSAGINLWIAGITANVTLCYIRPSNQQADCSQPITPISGTPVATGSDGELHVNVSGTLHWWLFGEHSKTINILATTIPIHFANPEYAAPAPARYAPPAAPQSTWPNPSWEYSTNMYLNVPWEPSELASAAGGSDAPVPVDPDHLADTLGVATDPTTVPQPVFDPQGTVTLGNNPDGSDSASTVTGNVPLPATPTYQQVVADYQQYVGPTLPANLKSQSQCAGSASKTFSVDVPQWNGGHPVSASNASFLVADINWRMYLASVAEAGSIEGDRGSAITNPRIRAIKQAQNYKCGYANWETFPAVQTWLTSNSAGPQFNLAYPQPITNTSTAQQLCQAEGDYPTSDFAAACATNLPLLNSDAAQPWGSGWGQSASPTPDWGGGSGSG
jgi:hypothetical protein